VKEVYEAIHRSQKAFVEELKELLRCPSVSYTGEGIYECADFLRRRLESWDISSRVVKTEGYPVVLGTIAPSRPTKTVLIYGHYDVKQPGDLSEWDAPPFDPVERQGFIFARGAADNKGQLLANILAVRILHQLGKLPVRVVFLLEGEEEVGSKGLPLFIETHREELKADLVYASDGPRHFSGRPTIHLGFRGLLKMRLTVQNEVGESVHSGNFGEIIRNPAWDLVQLLASMKTPEGEVTVPGFYDDVAPCSDVERQAMESIPELNEGVRRRFAFLRGHTPEGHWLDEQLMFRPTLTINGFDSGMESTIIPGQATAFLDVRLVKDMTPRSIFERIRDHVLGQGVPGVDLKEMSSYLPSKTAVDHPMVRLIYKAFEEMHQRGSLEGAPVLLPTLGGSLHNDLFTDTLGLPAIWVPYAQPDNGQHGPNEHLQISHFMTGIRMAATALTALGNTDP
jgi:acetylornithine deacetylase/succinyl-diaminopimelate desuccinylase-like protein